MPAFNFLARFAADVEAGRKRQTVRAKRRHRPRVGQTAYLFVGMRTAACRRLGAEPITGVVEIRVDVNGEVEIEDVFDGGLFPLSGPDADRFAQADGFADAAELVAWIETTHGLPFEGDVTYW